MVLDKYYLVIDLMELYGFEIVSYGLAPRPNGFCYELGDENYWDKPNEYVVADFNDLLERIELNDRQSKQLRDLIF